MTRGEALVFAERWAAAWNCRDLGAVLAHFDDAVAFTSPRAVEITGAATVHGKAALRAYWTKALAAVGALQFSIDRIVWDAASGELAIIYTSIVDGRRRRVSENLRFDEAGVVISAEVFHGVSE
ncbi:MAG: nuclear transport factor 2 family protein [Deltaproteobacteria bacterium]|nr:nuclear transport factor 2 family protein [Deltaproteobacteria bacterium]